MAHARLYIAGSIEESTVPSGMFVQEADIEHFVHDTFGINEARHLQKRAYLKPVSRATRDFLVSFKMVTSEAQNALLKLFEEPPENAVFHIVVSKESILIPTLRSRLLLVDIAQGSTTSDEFHSFLKMNYGERMDEIAKRTKAKDTVWIEKVAAGAETYTMKQKDVTKSEALKSIVFVRKYLGTRGASSKMLLEEMALSLHIQ